MLGYQFLAFCWVLWATKIVIKCFMTRSKKHKIIRLVCIILCVFPYKTKKKKIEPQSNFGQFIVNIPPGTLPTKVTLIKHMKCLQTSNTTSQWVNIRTEFQCEICHLGLSILFYSTIITSILILIFGHFFLNFYKYNFRKHCRSVVIHI